MTRRATFTFPNETEADRAARDRPLAQEDRAAPNDGDGGRSRCSLQVMLVPTSSARSLGCGT